MQQLAEDDLRSLQCDGYRPPQQRRTIETTHRVLEAAWDLMAERPESVLSVADVLKRSGTPSSSFYARFDGVHALIHALGLLLIEVERRSVDGADPRATPPRFGPPLSADSAARARGDVVDRATTESLSSLGGPGRVHHEVLTSGMWSEQYVREHSLSRESRIRKMSSPMAVAGGAGQPVAGAASSIYQRASTWLNVTTAMAEQVALIGTVPLVNVSTEALADRIRLVGRLLFAPTEEAWAAIGGLHDAPPAAMNRDAMTGHSDRHSRTIRDFRQATLRLLVMDGPNLTVVGIASEASRSPASFHDTFGTLGKALAEVALAEQVARIPMQVFRPRTEVGPAELIGHIAHRLRSWLDLQGISGRRLLQAAGQHPELAAVILHQVMESTQLLTSWYEPVLGLSPALTRVVFVAMLLFEQHQVIWGSVPEVVGGPQAIQALFAPLVERPA